MAETMLTLSLEGQVGLTDFTRAMTHFQELVEALCEYLNREAVIDWDVVALHAGSTTTTIRGSSLDREFLAQVSNAFVTIGQHMQRGHTIPYPPQIAAPATQLTHLLNGRITAIQFATPQQAIVIETSMPSPGRPGRVVSYGEIRGTVETLQRRRHRFTLYDDVFDQAVICHLRADQHEIMRHMWGKEVVVTGDITREVETYRPFEMRVVDDIRLVEQVPPGSYARTRGIMPFGDIRPADLLRRLRDAE